MPSKMTKSKNVTKPVNKLGGSIMDDINKLAVPFGLLLAEKGLSKLASAEKKEKKVSASKSKTVGRKAAVGGTTNMKMTQKAGSGSKNFTNEFSKLSNDIQNFLSAY